MQKAAKNYYTIEECLTLEEKAEDKSEYYRGEIFAMTGATMNHNQIAGNLYTPLNQAYPDKECRVFISDMRLWVKQKELFTYPDLLVICDKPVFYQNRRDTIANPLIIVEVLSESTKNYDRGGKFEFYRTLSTLKEYILIDQYKFHVEQFYIGSDNKWTLSEYNNENALLKFTKINFQNPLKTIYNGVDFEIE